MKFTVAMLTALLATAAHADTVVVTADRMVDVVAGRVVEKPVVVITDGRIVSVGTQGVAIPAGARRVDLPGKTLLPGLIDMHVHLTSLAEVGGYRRLEFTDSFWTAVGVANARKTLEAGFTTVRNVGAADFGDVGLRQAIDGGYVPGPRVVTATWGIGATGGHCDDTGLPPSYDHKAASQIDGARQPAKQCNNTRPSLPWLIDRDARPSS